MQQIASVGYKWGDAVGGPGIVLINLERIEGIGPEERAGDGVFLVAGVLYVRAKDGGVEHVNHAETAACGLVFVGGADAARGGANLHAAGGVLCGELDHAVVGQDDVSAIGEKEARADVNAEREQLVHLGEQGHGIEDDAVADNGDAVGAEGSAGNELEHEALAVNDDGVAGVVAAGIAGNDGKVSAKNVNDLALAFIAPLGAENDCSVGCHSGKLEASPLGIVSE